MSARETMLEALRGAERSLVRDGVEEGVRRGRLEGRRGALRRLLRTKFPEAPDNALTLLDDADGHRLDTWTTRALTAKTLEEALSRSIGESLFDEGLERGLERGRREGQRSVVERLLLLKFPHASLAPLNTATQELMDTWSERIVTATTLDEVFAP